MDLIYFQQDGRIYCGRHHAELFRPRCASCDQVGARQGRGFDPPFAVAKSSCAWLGAANAARAADGQEERFLPEPCREPHAHAKARGLLLLSLAQQSILRATGFLAGCLKEGSFSPLQLIFMEECIEAEGRRWHLEHFCCLECDVPLRGQRYVMKSGRPCCCGCFESLFAEPCQACGDPIGMAPVPSLPGAGHSGASLPGQAGRGLGGLRSQSPAAQCGGWVLAQGGGKSLPLTCSCPSGADSEEATHQGLHWHARAACFCCSLCRKPLHGQPLTSRHGRLFCSETCSLGWDASSTASDSSDSAFASAPSPDSTPLSRAGPAGKTVPGMGSTSAAGGCRQRVEGASRDPTAPRATWREGSGSQTRLCSAPGCFRGGTSHGCSPTQGWSSSDEPPAHVPQEGECWQRGFGTTLRCILRQPSLHEGLWARQAQPSPSSPVFAFLLPEAFLDQASVHPAFRSLEDHGEAAKERSRDAVHTGMLGPPAGHPSSPQPSAEGPNEPGAPSHLVLGDPDPRTPTGNRNPHFRAGTSPARHSTQLEDIDLQDITEEDDSWCPTCSSSSDSEEEGFFFGKPIPKPGMSSLGREPLGKAGGRTAKPRGSSKHCSVS